MPLFLQNIQVYLRYFLKPLLKLGDFAVDATAGRGRDTLFLAECVGSEGRVYAFDIQAEALSVTERLLKEHALEDRVVLAQVDHARMAEIVPRRVKLIMFNLGYLPGGDPSLITQPQSTLAALQAGLTLLQVNGVIAITVYRGHPGGEAEARAVEEFLAGVPASIFSVLKGEYINQVADAPYWIMIQRKREDLGHEDSPAEKNPGIDC